MLNTLELLSRIQIFQFFAPFVRQLLEIIADATPLGTFLLFFVTTQTILFWILDQNSFTPKYESLAGFANCFVDAYRLALGDFEVAGSFVENTDYIFMFWFIFIVNTLVALLIILNMVIAVMGSTFTRVEEQQTAHILRGKLILIFANYHRFP